MNQEGRPELQEEKVGSEEVGDAVSALRFAWRKYGYSQVVQFCIGQAQFENAQKGHEYLQTLPFVNQRLAQWALADPDCPRRGTHQLTVSTFRTLHKQAYDFVHGLAPQFLLGEIGIPALRAIAFQQFEFQNSSKFSVLRQYYIFGQLPANHKLVRDMLFADGLTFSELIVASYLIASFVTLNLGKPLSALQIQEMYRWFPAQKLRAAIRLFSASTDELRSHFQADPRKKISVLSALHRPAFRMRPLLKVSNSQYAVWSVPLLLAALGTIVYQRLKEAGDGDLVSEYGKVFEKKYVANAVACLSKKVVTEEELSAKAEGGLVVDFAIYERDSVLLVESKVKDADEATQASLEQSQIGDRFKTSLLKAIEQGFSTAVRVREGKHKESGLQPNADLFLLIITTDQHYLGNGQAVERHGGAERLLQLKKKFGGNYPIALENIVVLSAEGLDLLVTSSEAGLTDAFEFARKMSESEKSPAMNDKVLAGEQLLRLTSDDLPSYLRQAEQHWMTEILDKYQKARIQR